VANTAITARLTGDAAPRHRGILLEWKDEEVAEYDRSSLHSSRRREWRYGTVYSVRNEFRIDFQAQGRNEFSLVEEWSRARGIRWSENGVHVGY